MGPGVKKGKNRVFHAASGYGCLRHVCGMGAQTKKAPQVPLRGQFLIGSIPAALLSLHSVVARGAADGCALGYEPTIFQVSEVPVGLGH